MSIPLPTSPAESRGASRSVQAWRPKDIFHLGLDLRLESFYTRLGLAVTLAAAVLLGRDGWRVVTGAAHHGRWMDAVQLSAFMLIFLFLVYGNVLYQWTRHGYMRRLRRHRRAEDRALWPLFLEEGPSVTMLIPSYKEEIHVIRQSVLSCALQDYPDKRVVLLIDDNPDPSDPADILGLLNARNLPEEVNVLLAPARVDQQARHADFLNGDRYAAGLPDARRALRAAVEAAAAWFEDSGRHYPVKDHADRLFVELTFTARAADLRRQAAALESLLTPLAPEAQRDAIDAWHRRLVAAFSPEIATFERKQFENLSHAPNKAMNLNSYIGLMGRWLRSEERKDGVYLLDEEADARTSWYVHEPDFVLTLDADSVLAHDYALRLIHHACRPENARVAVVQTPYSAVPGSTGVLERVAGATTDMQYIVHQGFTACNATFWVGANAVLRKQALDEIATVDVERGHPILRYVHDRTVIEDTESSIDLICRNWTLHNYPERLSYSATPPDFGSLIVQRRRWANGGLIILPKLLKDLVRRFRLDRGPEAFMRFHYLASIAGVNLGVLLILLIPATAYMKMAWLPLTAVPYYVLYGRDLLQAGYRRGDLLRVYVLNLLLIPVNLAGVVKSIQQMITGRTIPFGRTPKVADRTATPRFYVAAELLFAGFCLFGGVFELVHGRWLNAAFALSNGGLIAYGIAAFMGVKTSWQDLRGHGAPSPTPRPDQPPVKRPPVETVGV